MIENKESTVGSGQSDCWFMTVLSETTESLFEKLRSLFYLGWIASFLTCI